ncbi:hypothetical protein [Streptomyces sp. NPDC001980]|uniref:hypothetical protein n=1 Tax=Streptomyces sp. NPDC001980 TaxID=3157126 RepID=UPI003326654D
MPVRVIRLKSEVCEIPQEAIEAALFVGTLEAPEITPLGSLDADRGTTVMTPEGENPKPFLVIIHSGI